MRISSDTIELIRERADIVDIVRRYVPDLKKKGKNYLGLCPFHREKTPSFTVTPEKGIFYCFGCHTGGNVFSFIQKIEGLDFPDSVRRLGDILGIHIQEENGREERNPFYEINRSAAELYHSILKLSAGKTGLDYLLNRGVNAESIDNFQLGYAPDSWNTLTDHLRKNNADMEQAASLGILSVSDKQERKHYYDRFRGRVIFPITGRNGKTVAFGGRVTGDGTPKYLNSPESSIFHKRMELYGFHQAREHISELKRAIVVEGYLDVIGCHQAGIKNVVAPLGTALTPEQVQTLARLCTEIVILFDADSAGINAALRSLSLGESINTEMRIALLPEGDPFDYIGTRGVREFMTIVDSAMKPVDFRLNRAWAELRFGDPMILLTRMFEILGELQFESERSMYLGKISNLLELDEKAVRLDFASFLEKKIPAGKSFNKDKQHDIPEDFLTRSYRQLIKLLCLYPDLIEKAIIDFPLEEITDPLARKIFTTITELHHSTAGYSLDRLFDNIKDGEETIVLHEILQAVPELEDHRAAYTEIYLTMKIHQIDRKMTDLADKIRKSPASGGNYLTEFEILRREKEKLSSYVYNRGQKH